MAEATTAEGTQTTAPTEGTQSAAPAEGTQTTAAAEGAKPEGTQTAAPAEGTKPAEGTQAAPETYSDFKAPEGITLSEDVVSELKALGKEINLTQDAAQKVVDRMAPKIAARTEAALKEAVAAKHAEWGKAAKADAEFGGEKFDANIAVAKQFRDTFGSPALNQFLNESGLGNHPEMVRLFYRAGQKLSEDKTITGDRGTVAAKSLYANSNMNP